MERAFDLGDGDLERARGCSPDAARLSVAPKLRILAYGPDRFVRIVLRAIRNRRETVLDLETNTNSLRLVYGALDQLFWMGSHYNTHSPVCDTSADQQEPGQTPAELSSAGRLGGPLRALFDRNSAGTLVESGMGDRSADDPGGGVLSVGSKALALLRYIQSCDAHAVHCFDLQFVATDRDDITLFWETT